MNVSIRKYEKNDSESVNRIWNSIVAEGAAFPQEEELNEISGPEFFQSQTFTGVAADGSGTIAGVYILHPNNVGRCGHICNASYAVADSFRGKGIGELLVRHCMSQAKKEGFRILQFNAVVSSNLPALALYRKIGFTQLGTIPGGFRSKDGTYSDIIPHYILL
jgi:L-amino acid N-acyltransferase YncA